VKYNHTKFNGCYVIDTDVHYDSRGSFTKCYNEKEFLKNGINYAFKEQFFTVSHKNVLRGMHFQLPPHDHCKLVSCFSGAVLDVLLDLRKGSRSYLLTMERLCLFQLVWRMVSLVWKIIAVCCIAHRLNMHQIMMLVYGGIALSIIGQLRIQLCLHEMIINLYFMK